LQGYRVRRGTDPRTLAERRTFSGRTVDVPSCFIAGKADWGSFQNPGVLEAMQSAVCTDWRGAHFVEGAGHWAQQEQPEAVARLLLEFLKGQL
jgi:pimeloyl-ACP methyl ester carboxylesterase